MRIFILPFLLFAGVLLSAQSSVIDPRLYAAKDSATLARVLSQNPQLLQRWNYYLDHAWIITEYPAEKGDITLLPVVHLADTDHFNILVLEKTQPLARHWDHAVFYRIDDSDRVLMYFAGKDFNRKFQDWLLH